MVWLIPSLGSSRTASRASVREESALLQIGQGHQAAHDRRGGRLTRGPEQGVEGRPGFALVDIGRAELDLGVEVGRIRRQRLLQQVDRPGVLARAAEDQRLADQ
jgi:hypothetical protein